MVYLRIPTAFTLGFVVKSGNIVNELEKLEKSFQNGSSADLSGHIVYSLYPAVVPYPSTKTAISSKPIKHCRCSYVLVFYKTNNFTAKNKQ